MVNEDNKQHEFSLTVEEGNTTAYSEQFTLAAPSAGENPYKIVTSELNEVSGEITISTEVPDAGVKKEETYTDDWCYSFIIKYTGNNLAYLVSEEEECNSGMTSPSTNSTSRNFASGSKTTEK